MTGFLGISHHCTFSSSSYSSLYVVGFSTCATPSQPNFSDPSCLLSASSSHIPLCLFFSRDGLRVVSAMFINLILSRYIPHISCLCVCIYEYVRNSLARLFSDRQCSR